MVEEMKYDRVAPTKQHNRSIISGVLVAALGLLVLAIAATEYYIFADIAVPGDAVNGLLGMTAGAVRVAKSRVLQRLRAELGDAE